MKGGPTDVGARSGYKTRCELSVIFTPVAKKTNGNASDKNVAP